MAATRRFMVALLTLALLLYLGGGCKEKKYIIASPFTSAPGIAEIPGQTAELGVEFTFDLSLYVSDNLTPLADLSFSVISGGGIFNGSVYTNTFTSPGGEVVFFSVTDGDNESSTGYFGVTVENPANTAPVVDPIPMQIAPDYQNLTGETFTFNMAVVGNVRDDHDASENLIYKVTSGFGCFTGPIFYVTPIGSLNPVTVSFSITDLEGAYTNSSFQLFMVGVPQADFSANATFGTAPLAVQFTDASTGCASMYYWRFKTQYGPVDSYEKNPTYTYTEAGKYSVEHGAVNIAGSDSNYREDYIWVLPQITCYVNGSESVSGDGTSWGTAFVTIQEALDVAQDNETVIVADGIYSGDCNTNLDFHGRAVSLISQNGPGACVIDGESANRLFNLTSGESRSTLIYGFTIRNGYSTPYGGAIQCLGASPMIANCDFDNNYATNGGAVYGNASGLLLQNCSFTRNSATSGGAVWVLYNDASGPETLYPTLEKCSFSANIATGDGGAFRSGVTWLTISDCVFDNNQAAMGGAVYDYDGMYEIKWCRFTNNYSSGSGGAVQLDGLGDATISDCLFAFNNTSGDGGAFHLTNRMVTGLNCTIANNSAASEGGGIYCTGSAGVLADLYNFIIWNNDASSGGRQLFINNAGFDVTLSYCCYDTSAGHAAGAGISGLDYSNSWIFSDPLFVDPANCDFHLQEGSVCIDSGDTAIYNSILYEYIDLDGNPRFVYGIVDIGAYEYQY
ncbi:MAG: choice-of-anchor Q domain-containing protein [Planctomycetota bacterium]